MLRTIDELICFLSYFDRWKVVKHYVTRVKGNLEMMDQLDMIGKASEFARVFGIEFYHVLSRGSQVRLVLPKHFFFFFTKFTQNIWTP